MFGRLPAAAVLVGIPWYRRSDYRRIVEIMADGQSLPTTFDKWQSKAEAVERQLRAEGRVPVRAPIDPEQFVAWCAARGLDIDAGARMRFASDIARRKLLDSDGEA